MSAPVTTRVPTSNDHGRSVGRRRATSACSCDRLKSSCTSPTAPWAKAIVATSVTSLGAFPRRRMTPCSTPNP